MRSSCLAGACVLVLALVGSACSSGGKPPAAARATPAATAPETPQPQEWVPINLVSRSPFGSSDIYDPTCNCVWVLSRVFGPAAGADTMELTRVNVADRSVHMVLTTPAVDDDAGLIALDPYGVVWMGWGETLMRFDPATGTAKSWTRPPYSGLARVYSMDGRMISMTIDSNGEVWVVAGMLTAVFGFNPVKEIWDRVINLPFAPGDLAAPAPGILTLSGTALAGGALDPNYSPRFAVITTATRAVRTIPIPVQSYVSIGSGRILYSNGAGSLIRYDLFMGTSATVSKAPSPSMSIVNMAVSPDGNVWLGNTTQGFPGVARLNPSTGAVTQFPFPVEIRYYQPAPTPPSGFCMPHECFPLPCNPVLAFHCVPATVSLNPEVESLAPDRDGNLWMVTGSSSVVNPTADESLFAPLIELQPSAA